LADRLADGRAHRDDEGLGKGQDGTDCRADTEEHKPTLLAMLGPDVDAEREAIQREAKAPSEAVAFPFGANTRCLVHLDPTQWEEQPAPARPGWLRTTCKRCGTFIGYRPERGMN
jgi:hypothetical protein